MLEEWMLFLSMCGIDSLKCEMNDDDDEKDDSNDERCTNVNVVNCTSRVCDFVIGKWEGTICVNKYTHRIYCMYCVFWNPSLCLLLWTSCFYATNPLSLRTTVKKKYAASLEMRSVCIHVRVWMWVSACVFVHA